MDINEYYKRAESIVYRIEGVCTTLNDALNYNSDNDHPSLWIPNVQAALIGFFKVNPKHELSEEILQLYIQGEIMENKAYGNAFIYFALGLLFSWVIF
jgi:hypothetical protein